MKKKDFLLPFKYEDRRPIILNKLLYIPNNYIDHEKFDQKIVFENDNPINIEYCSGNGEWIIDKVKKNPSINYIAVEMKFKRARKIWLKLMKENLNNLFIVMGEAYVFTKFYLKDLKISEIYVNFPDPWPKRKHFKNRLINEIFINEVLKNLKDKGKFYLVTDHVGYRDHMIDVFSKNRSFLPFYKKPYYIQNLVDFGSSYFDTFFRNLKKSINYLIFLKK